MEKSSGHIETLIATILLATVVIVLVVATGDTRGLVIAAVVAALIMAVVVITLISSRSPKEGEGGDYRTLDDFLDEYAYELDKDLHIIIDDFQGQGEYTLAVEWVSDKIYDDDIAISPEGVRLFRRLAEETGVSEEYWRFMEAGPPYPDLVGAERDEATAPLTEPSLEAAESFAREGKTIVAVRMYREVTGASISEAKKAIDEWSSQQGVSTDA